MNHRLRERRRANSSLANVQHQLHEIRRDVVDLWLAEWARHAERTDEDEATIARVRRLARLVDRSAGYTMHCVQDFGLREARHLRIVEENQP